MMNYETKKVQRNFIPGDEWFYIKIYTGYKTSDTIIREIIYPLSEHLLNENIIDKWFFIRYNDPKYHIRIRFHSLNKEKVSGIISKLHPLLASFVEDGLIWKVQTDTYQREIERYGINTMELSEDLFFIDSMFTGNLFRKMYGKEDENTRWLLSAKMIDTFLSLFMFDLQQKSNFLNMLQENFAKEFGFGKEGKKQFAAKYRTHKKELEDIMNWTTLKEYEDIITTKSIKMKSVIESILGLYHSKNLDVDLHSLITSYIHMMINRIFRTNQRKYELVIYDFLYNHYKSQVARQSKQIEVDEHQHFAESINV